MKVDDCAWLFVPRWRQMVGALLLVVVKKRKRASRARVVVLHD